MIADPAASAGSTNADWVWTCSGVAGSTEAAASADVRVAGYLFEPERLAHDLALPAAAPVMDIVAAGYRRWGLDLLQRVRGAFALSIHDPREGRTFVVRDQLGLQPVFYTANGNEVAVAADARLLARRNGGVRLNRLALADAVCRRYPDSEETFFENVRRLPGGALLEIGERQVRVRRYWDPLAESGPSATSPDSAYDRFEELQRQAVRRASSRGRSAIFLSGGLDSVGIAVTAAGLARNAGSDTPLALSLAFPDRTCDEREVQRAVADRLGLPQVLLEFDEAVGSEPLLTQGLRLNRALSSPLRNFWRPVYGALARRGAARGVTAVITGEGGDEWMAASAYSAADFMSRGRLVSLGRFLGAWGRAEEKTGMLWHRGLRPVAGRVAAAVIGSRWDRRRARRLTACDPSWMVQDQALRRAQEARALGALGPSRPRRGFAGAEREMSLWGSASLQDREEMFVVGQLAGVSFVHPYHDVDLIEFFARLPVRLSNADGWLRGLPRRQLAARFPSLGFARQRKVLASRFHRATLVQAWQQLPAPVEFPTLAALGIVDSARASEYVRRSAAHARRAHELVNVESWARQQLEY